MTNKLTLIASSVILAISPSLQAKENVSVFDEVVVSGTRSEQSIKNVPSSVSKVTAEEMEQNLATDITQAVKYEPGVQVNGRGRFGMQDFTIRGMSGNRVKVLLDGVEQPSSYNPGADAMRKNSNGFDVDTLTAIEINKGPSSTLYGSDALGGTVYMRTKKPEDMLQAGDDTHVGVKTGYASANDEYKATVELANRTGDLESMVIYTYRNGHETEVHGDGADVIGEQRGAANPFGYDSHNVLGKLFYQLNENHRVGLTGEFNTKSQDGRNLSQEGYDGGMGMMPGFVYTNVHFDDKDDRYRVGLEHEWLANNVVFDTLKWQLSWSESETEHHNFDHTGRYGNRDRLRKGKDDSLQFDLQMQKELQLSRSRHELTYGIAASDASFDLDYTDYFLDRGTSSPGSSEVPKSDSEKRAVFVQDQIFLMDDQMVVTAGLRYDDFKAKPQGDSDLKEHNSDKLTSRLGAVYHWTDNFSTYAQYSEGFRSPTIYELYYAKDNAAHGYKLEANPDLKPEESQSYEIGLRGNNRYGAVEMSFFYNDYKNFIKSQTNDVGGIDITKNENIDKARIYGSELKGSLWLDEAFGAPMGTYARLAMTYMDGENKETGDTLDTVAPFIAVVGLGYDAPSEMWGGALTVTAADRKDEWERPDAGQKPNVDAPGYAVVDLTTYYRPTNDLTLRAGLFNAFDKKYWQYQNLAGDSTATEQGKLDRQAEAGRNWGVTVDYAF